MAGHMGGDDGEMTDDSAFYFSLLGHVSGNDKQLARTLAAWLWCSGYLRTHARTHLHAQSHADHSLACICCQLSQTVGNPPPLKQKDLFLSCYRQTGTHTHTQRETHTPVSVVFSAETKNITLIPTDLFFTVVLLLTLKAVGQIVILMSIFMGGKKQCDKKKRQLNAWTCWLNPLK